MELINIILTLLFIICVIASINTDLKYNYKVNYFNYVAVSIIYINLLIIINILYKGLL